MAKASKDAPPATGPHWGRFLVGAQTRKFWSVEDGEPFPDDTHVALTHWSVGGTNGNPDGQLGVWQHCTDVSGEVVQEFMADYPAEDSPEPGAA